MKSRIVSLAVGFLFISPMTLAQDTPPVELYCSSQLGGTYYGKVMPQEICYASDSATSHEPSLVIIKMKDGSHCREAFTSGDDPCYKKAETKIYRILGSEKIKAYKNGPWDVKDVRISLKNVKTGEETFLIESHDQSPFPIGSVTGGPLGGLQAFYLTPGKASPLRSEFEKRSDGLMDHRVFDSQQKKNSGSDSAGPSAEEKKAIKAGSAQ